MTTVKCSPSDVGEASYSIVPWRIIRWRLDIQRNRRRSNSVATTRSVGAGGTDQILGEAGDDYLSGGGEILDSCSERDACVGNSQVSADTAVLYEQFTCVP